MTSLQDFAIPVHKSLQQPDLIMGIPKDILVFLLCFTVILVYLLGLWFALTAAVVYIPCRLLSNEDPQMLSIAVESLLQPENLEG
jgi:type IV secretory pathway VirB3-like protein